MMTVTDDHSVLCDLYLFIPSFLYSCCVVTGQDIVVFTLFYFYSLLLCIHFLLFISI